MDGVVYAMNPRRGMVAIATEDAGFTIIEMLSSEDIEPGDEMYWEDDTALGHEMYRNVSKDSTFEVFVQNHWVSRGQLKQQLLIR
jgi:glutamine phosphoribosylpyrophosphate amidotransferase